MFQLLNMPIFLSMLLSLNLNYQMNKCTVCDKHYTHSNQSNGGTPRVLIKCGHTFCQNCIESRLQSSIISCFNCKKNTQIDKIEELPLNEALIDIMKNNIAPQQHLCKIHNKKIEAYCEKDCELLCVECTLNKHKTHKMCLISEKAAKERDNFKQSKNKIKESLVQYNKIQSELDDQINKIRCQFADYQLEINVFFKNITEELKNFQQKQLEKGNLQVQQYHKKLQALKLDNQEKIKFISEIKGLYEELTEAQDIDFLRQQSKRAFIMDNCKVKKRKLNLEVLQFRRVCCIEQLINYFQEMYSYEKRRVLHNQNYKINESPPMKKRFSKEPAILEVNLCEQYNKRVTNKQSNVYVKPKKKTIIINSDKNKSKDRILQAVGGATQRQNVVQKQIIIKKSNNENSSNKKSINFSHTSLCQEFQFEESCNFTPVSSFQSFLKSQVQSNNSSPHNNSNQFNSQFTLLQCEQKVFHFGGVSRNMIQVFNCQTKHCEKIGMEINRNRFHCVIAKGINPDKCFLIGGRNSLEGQKMSDVYQFFFKTKKIEKSKFSLSQKKSGFGAVAKDKVIYIVGGSNNEQRTLNKFEKYEFAGKNYIISKMPPMTNNRDELGCCLGLDGFLYVSGGVNNSNSIQTSCQRFNFEIQQWQTMPSMKYPRRGFSMISAPHGIFVIGGHSGQRELNEIEVYLFEEKRWKSLAPMKNSRCYQSAIISYDCQFITIFGGFSNTNILNSWETYDIQKNQWISQGKMLDKRYMHCSVLCPL